MCISRSRGSVDQDKRTVSDAVAETYDNVPLDNNLSNTAQNGFVSIITSKFLALLVCIFIHQCSSNINRFSKFFFGTLGRQFK